MILEVWKKEKANVHLRLVDDFGDVLLIAVDRAGNPISCGVIARITEKGITRGWGVDPGLGFPLNDIGQVNLYEE